MTTTTKNRTKHTARGGDGVSGIASALDWPSKTGVQGVDKALTGFREAQEQLATLRDRTAEVDAAAELAKTAKKAAAREGADDATLDKLGDEHKAAKKAQERHVLRLDAAKAAHEDAYQLARATVITNEAELVSTALDKAASDLDNLVTARKYIQNAAEALPDSLGSALAFQKGDTSRLIARLDHRTAKIAEAFELVSQAYAEAFAVVQELRDEQRTKPAPEPIEPEAAPVAELDDEDGEDIDIEEDDE